MIRRPKAASRSERSSLPLQPTQPSTSPSLMDLARQLSSALEADAPEFLQLAKSLNVRPRKAYYLAEIGRKLGGLGIPDNELNAIGWTKLQLIAEHVDKSDARVLLDAATMSVPKLRQFLAGENEPEGKRAVLFYLSTEQYSLLEQVILRHGGRRVGSKGLHNKEEALTAALAKLANVS